MEDLEINLPVGDDEPTQEELDTDTVPFDEEPETVVEEGNKPVRYTAKVSDIEVMQFSRPTDVEAIVNWGEGATRNEPPFIAVITNKGPILVEQGQYIAKTTTGFRVLSQQELDDEFEVTSDVQDSSTD